MEERKEKRDEDDETKARKKERGDKERGDKESEEKKGNKKEKVTK